MLRQLLFETPDRFLDRLLLGFPLVIELLF
jgi:hypothetical protein